MSSPERPSAREPEPLTLFDVSVPVFARYLVRQADMLRLAEEHAASHGLDPPTLLQARMAPDMLGLAAQVEIAANFVFRACAPLAGLDVPAFGERRDYFAALRERVAQASAFLASLTPAQMQRSDERRFSSQAGHAVVALGGTEFLLHYALPNFFFHVTTAYAILRHVGVPLGKANFDGFHVYGGPTPAA